MFEFSQELYLNLVLQRKAFGLCLVQAMSDLAAQARKEYIEAYRRALAESRAAAKVTLNHGATTRSRAKRSIHHTGFTTTKPLLKIVRQSRSSRSTSRPTSRKATQQEARQHPATSRATSRRQAARRLPSPVVVPSIGLQLLSHATPNVEARHAYSNSLFGPVFGDIKQKITEFPIYKQRVDSWRRKDRLLHIESRDTMVMPPNMIKRFISKEVKRNICKATVLQSYVRKAFVKAFENQTDDWIAVMSTSMDKSNQADWKLEAFLFAGLSSTYHEALVPVWELSLICTGELSGIGLTLVQSFVYAAKVYTIKHATPPIVFLDLAEGYSNTVGLATYSHVGYSTLSHLLKEEPIRSIIAQKIRDEGNRSEIVTYASVFMALDLERVSEADLKDNIGRKTAPFFELPTIDTLLGLAAKMRHVFTEDVCDAACKAKVETAIERAFQLAKDFYNLHDAEFESKHTDLVNFLQGVVHDYAAILTATKAPSLASSSGGGSKPSLASSSGGGSKPSLASSSGGGSEPSLASSSGGGSKPSLASSSGGKAFVDLSSDSSLRDDDSLSDDDYLSDEAFATKLASPTESPSDFALLSDDDDAYPPRTVGTSRGYTLTQNPLGDLVWSRPAEPVHLLTQLSPDELA